MLLKGSVSSKNCTRQANVAMMHPCSEGREPRDRRARGIGRRGHCEQGRPPPPLAGSRARRLRRAGLQPRLRPRGGGAGAGPAGPLHLLLPRLLPSSVPLEPGPAAPTEQISRREREDRTAPAAYAALRQAGWRWRRGGDTPRWADPRKRHAIWANGCTCVPRPGTPGLSCTARCSGNRVGVLGGKVHGCPLAFSPSGRGPNAFQMKAAAAAGSCCPDSENPSWAPGGEGDGLPQQERVWQHLESRRGFPREEES